MTVFANKEIKPDDTLIVFDEIQAATGGLTALKYFCEDAPEYHVIAAGENVDSVSFKFFCKKFCPTKAVRTSLLDYKEESWMTNVPLYAINTLTDAVPAT